MPQKLPAKPREVIVVIGGGPSFRPHDYAGLEHFFTIGCNRVAWDIGTDAFFTCDAGIHRGFRAEIERFKGEKHFALIEDMPDRYRGAIYHKRDCSSAPLSDRPDGIRCDNSGHGAFNLAYKMRPKRIILAGFDMMAMGNRYRWHDGYAWNQKPSEQLMAGWAEQFDATVPMLRAAGIDVVNTSYPTRVTAFPVMRWQDAVQRQHC